MDKALAQKIKDLMAHNREQTNGASYTLPSPDSYPYQWLWDSCFHAIILSHFDLPAAKAELLSLTEHQFPNGMLPHMVYWRSVKSEFPRIRWGRGSTSSITQPPMLAYAVWQIHQLQADPEFVRQMLPVINNFHRYLLKARDPRKHHLVGIIHPDESGEDNSPRFDEAMDQAVGRHVNDTFFYRKALVSRYRAYHFAIKNRMDRRFWVRDVPFNAILVRNLRAQAKLAEQLGDRRQATWAKTQAAAVKKAMRHHFLTDDGVMRSTYGRKYQLVKAQTWAMFAPLFAGLLTKQEAHDLVNKHLINPSEFAANFSVPTVALNDPTYDPTGFWRGPVWMSTNWFIVKGLQRYGYDKEATAIIKQSLDLLKKSGFREQFNPMTADGYGAHNFTWGCLIQDMIEPL